MKKVNCFKLPVTDCVELPIEQWYCIVLGSWVSKINVYAANIQMPHDYTLKELLGITF